MKSTVLVLGLAAIPSVWSVDCNPDPNRFILGRPKCSGSASSSRMQQSSSVAARAFSVRGSVPSSRAASSSVVASSSARASSSVPASSSAPASSSVPASSSIARSSSIQASSSAASPSASAASDYISRVLYHHNVHRTNHSAPALQWNAALAATALKTAQTCVYQHDTTTDGGGYGQNIAAGYPLNGISQVISDGWYNSEVNSYTYYGGEPNLNTLSNWGHMSQVVWVNSASVGCVSYDCSARGLANTAGNIPPFFHICNYGPPGNFVGAFGANVLRPLGLPTITG